MGYGAKAGWLFRRGGAKAKASRPRALLWTALIGLIFGAIGFGQPLEDMLRTLRNSFHQDQASGDIVLVAIDERSLRELHNWPWPRRYHARMANELSRLGAKRVFFDIIFSSPSAPVDDQLFTKSLARSRPRVTLPVGLAPDEADLENGIFPLQEFRKHANLSAIVFTADYQRAAWHLPFAWNIAGREYPSLAATLAGRSGGTNGEFPVDYSIDAATIPKVSAVDLVKGRIPANTIAGKDVVIGTTSSLLDDVFLVPGMGQRGGVYVHILGAETLKKGVPISFGWLPALILGLIAAAGSLRLRNKVQASALLSITSLALLLAPLLLEARMIFVDVVPALFVLFVTAGTLAWSRLRRQATLNAVSGLPNLNALRHDRSRHDRPLIAARVQNYAEIASALPAEGEKVLVEQIVARLTVGGSGQNVYHGDDGLFVWFFDQGGTDEISTHLDALSALFRSPLKVASAQFDVAISFGVDTGGERSLANRLGSALVAADEAAREGHRWKHYDPDKLKDAAWKLSLLSQLDAAVDAGQLWIALQPKLDLSTNRLCGAEALVRWTHPTKGLLHPSEFVLAAEQSGRIERLTEFVLQQAIGFAAAIRQRGVSFPIAVNLSMRLLDWPGLSSRVADLLATGRLPPELLTLEITETAALAASVNLQSLEQLRRLGVRISIDDYGTGQSTLEYLKRIPASEIKIDQSFVQAIGKSRSDRLLVHSTIQLAHSLGQTVVAEGVEDEDTLAALREMGCDVAQGFYIGRPLRARSLAKRLFQERRQAA